MLRTDPSFAMRWRDQQEVLEMRAQRKRKLSGLPVVENGKVVGIVTNRDLRFENRRLLRSTTESIGSSFTSTAMEKPAAIDFFNNHSHC